MEQSELNSPTFRVKDLDVTTLTTCGASKGWLARGGSSRNQLQIQVAKKPNSKLPARLGHGMGSAHLKLLACDPRLKALFCFVFSLLVVEW